MGPTTFGDAISAAPQLGNMCILLLTADNVSSGLKHMRLVSKQVRSAMLRLVRGYNMQLDGSATSLVAEMSLLENARLSRLRVTVVSEGEVSGAGMHVQSTLCAVTVCTSTRIA